MEPKCGNDGDPEMVWRRTRYGVGDVVMVMVMVNLGRQATVSRYGSGDVAMVMVKVWRQAAVARYVGGREGVGKGIDNDAGDSTD